MIFYLWDAPPRCGISGSLEKAQEAADHVPSARVESARLALGVAWESTYARTGQVWRSRRAEGGAATWELGDAG